MSYMLMEAGYQLGIAKDKTKIWVWKPLMRLGFVLKDGLYRMWTKRLSEGTPVADHVVLVVEKTAVVSNNEAMSMLHQRLGHAGMEEIKRMIGHVDFGVKKNAAQLSIYDCVPCRMEKFRRMTYRSKTSRPERPLQKLSDDVCTLKHPALARRRDYKV
ncbi:hypothetical protein PR003_g16833 [Phytophthora rubi]|uniref:GAG-pre-integrase domain-containing protein n=1 Tax=Phytophthora rubi TaxID=129364 RepID=A0A6A4EVN2_9STRA|nr:hypothetical protein PR003_g16833 [Phytophthora rubi]